MLILDVQPFQAFPRSPQLVYRVPPLHIYVVLRHPRSHGCSPRCGWAFTSLFALVFFVAFVHAVNSLERIIAVHSFVTHPSAAVIVPLRDTDIQPGQLVFFWK